MKQMDQATRQLEVPVLKSESIARLPMLVFAGFAGTAILLATLTIVSGPSHWWTAFAHATVVSAIAMIASIFTARFAGGKSLDSAITVFMALSAVRLIVALAGCIVTVKLFKSPAEPTAFMICAYAIASLIVESAVMARAVRAVDRREAVTVAQHGTKAITNKEAG